MAMLISHGGIKIENSEGLTKQNIREKIWTFMIERNIARKPIPIFNRIPNFEGAGKSANKITTVEAFSSAQIVKVDPDKPLEDVRFLSLIFRKKLLVPSPRLQSGLLMLLWNDSEDDVESLRNKVQSEGIKNLSIPLDLNLKIKVDVIVSGAVAVSLKGRRIGKGEGFADLEYALMKNMNMINDNAIVIVVVHDCQVFDELPPQLFEEHDVPVDVIVTPTQIIYTKHTLPKPEGIYWHLLSEEKIKQIPILKLLKTLPKNSFSSSNVGNPSPDWRSANFNTNHSTHFEGHGKGRGYTNTSKANRGRNPYNYDNKERNPYNYDNRGRNPYNYDREQQQQQRNSYANDYRNQESYNSYNKRKEKQYRHQSHDPSGSEKNDNGHIHVTISVDKRNHVINRTVEESNELDRVGDASETTLVSEATQELSSKTVGNQNFTIYIGGIPKECRFTDLREELNKRGVKPSYIAWKGFDYAFLDFKNSRLSVSDILESLKDFSLKGKLLKVNHKQYSKDKSNQDEGSSSKNNKEESSEVHSSTENSPRKSVKSTEHQIVRTKKADSDKMQNIDTPTKKVEVSSSGKSSSTKNPRENIVASTKCQNAKTEAADNQKEQNGNIEIKHSNVTVTEAQNNKIESIEECKSIDNQNDTSEDGWGPIDDSIPREDYGWK